jgi:hypothetical protein
LSDAHRIGFFQRNAKPCGTLVAGKLAEPAAVEGTSIERSAMFVASKQLQSDNQSNAISSMEKLPP